MQSDFKHHVLNLNNGMGIRVLETWKHQTSPTDTIWKRND